MSRLKQLILTLFVLSSVSILYYFHPYFTVSLVLLSLVIYLYIDYENQQPRQRRDHTRPSSVGSYLNELWSWAVTYIQNKYQLILLTTKPNNTTNRPNMPSITPHTVNSRRPTVEQNRSTSSFLVSPNLNENRLRSEVNLRRPSLNSSDAFNALSPIRRNTSHEFNNLSISGIRSPHQTSNQQNSNHTSYMSDSSRDLSFKQPRSGSATRNVQAFAGPLLASTRYNLSSDSALFADVNSPGFSSRVAKYGSDSLNSSRSVTHQAQYAGPGQFPIVHLGRTSKLPVLSARNSQKLARTPVRLRMAPPESDERRSYSLSDRSQILSDFTPNMSTPKSVLDTLHELSRKRLHAQLGEADEEAVKKHRKADDDGATQKRGRDEACADDDRTKKKTRSNEILSSLSSSRNLVSAERPSVKRKTSTGDLVSGSTPMPAGKVPKKSLPSPEAAATSAEVCEMAVQTESELPAPRVTPQPIASPQPMEDNSVADAAKYKKEVRGDWLRRGFLNTEQDLNLSMIQEKRVDDTRGRLKGMMSIISGRVDDASSPGLNFSSVTPAVSVSTSLPSVSSAKPAAEKHVHFADNLTQVKTFETNTTSFGSASLVGSTSVVSSSSDAGKTPPTKSTSSTLDGFKMPSNAAQDSVTVYGFPSSSAVVETKKTAAGGTTGGGFSFGQTASPSLGQSITVATPSSTVLGQISSPVVAKTSIVAPTFGQMAPALVATVTQTSSPIMSTTFGRTDAPSTLGQQTTAAATLPSPVVSTFGQNSSFGSTVSSPALFGSVTASFGSSTSTAGETSAPPKISFGSSSTFGGSTASPSGFGAAPPSLASTAPSLAMPVAAFGSSTLQFGSPAAPSVTTSSTFSSPVPSVGFGFGSSATTVATSAPVFGSSAPSLATTVPQDGGFSAAASKVEPPKLFGFGAVTSPLSNVFSSQTKSSSFGTSQNPPPPYGAVTTTTTQGGFAFAGGSNTTSNIDSSPMFGGKTEQQATAPTFGAASKSSAFQFTSSQSATTETSQGGGGFKFDLSQPSKPNPLPSLFGGGFNSTNADSKPANTQGTFAFGAAPPKTFGFGDAAAKSGNPPSLFGNANTSSIPVSSVQSPSGGFGQNVFGSQSQQQTGVNASNLTQIPTQPKPAGLFSFGSSAQQATPAASTSGGFAFGNPAKPSGFAFGGAVAQGTPTFGQTAQAAPPTFGQTAQAASPTFGQTTQSAPPTFGQTAQSAPPTFGQTAPPTFGQAAQSGSLTFGQTAQAAPPTFGQTTQPAPPTFGQAQQPAAPGGAFQFGSVAAPSTGGFNFGGSSSNLAAQTPTFGGAAASNAFQMGGAPQFGGQQQQQAPGMFSIGTGSSAPRGRLARSRRPR